MLRDATRKAVLKTDRGKQAARTAPFLHGTRSRSSDVYIVPLRKRCIRAPKNRIRPGVSCLSRRREIYGNDVVRLELSLGKEYHTSRPEKKKVSFAMPRRQRRRNILALAENLFIYLFF